MSVVLAIDTAAPRLQLALRRDDGTTDISIDELAQGHAELLFPRLETLLAGNDVGYPDLTRIVVTTGPGSFTGLRIGISAARGLGLALGIPVIGMPSLFALSLHGEPGHPQAVLLDARRGEAYFQRFFAPAQPWDDPRLLPIAEARNLVQHGVTPIETPFPDIAKIAASGRDLNPNLFRPEPLYVRGADAKPQERARVARVEAG
jgi:tRNA threonylcarbamoyl adenosine modification protein YeaZ